MVWSVKIYSVKIGVDKFNKIMGDISLISTVFSSKEDNLSGEAWDIEIFFGDKPDATELDIQLRLICLINNYPIPKFKIREIFDIDWRKVNQEAFPDIFIGRFHLILNPTQKEKNSFKNIVYLRAAEAFGTGYHNSTKGCILALEYLKKRSKIDHLLANGNKCLDLGSGSGILSFIFCRLWPSKVLATDIDPVALDISRQFAKENYLSNRVTFMIKDKISANNKINRGNYALVMANILANPLKKLVNEIKKNTIKNSRVLLSGILVEQLNYILSIYRTHGFVLEKKWILGHWVILLFYKP